MRKPHRMIDTTVANLFIHGMQSSRPEDTRPTPMLAMSRLEAVQDWGIKQDTRYFRPPDPGRERLRQVSLIDEGTIRRHEAIFGPIDRSLIKAQIVVAGDIFLPDLLDSVLVFEGGAELTLSKVREPCFAMDLIAAGLREAMRPRQQGVLARVTRSGIIHMGQKISLRGAEEAA